MADGVVSIKPRKRGSPVDVMVSELMIFANSHWGSELKNADISGLFRVKTKSNRFVGSSSSSRDDGRGGLRLG